MRSTVVYEADRTEFLDRAARTQALLAEMAGSEPIDVARWAERMKAILLEVRLPALELGARYRVRMIGGKARLEHRHYEDEAGQIHGLDMPAADVAYIEVDGDYLGVKPDGPFAGQHVLEMEPGKAATFTDSDVLRLERVA